MTPQEIRALAPAGADVYELPVRATLLVLAGRTLTDSQARTLLDALGKLGYRGALIRVERPGELRLFDLGAPLSPDA